MILSGFVENVQLLSRILLFVENKNRKKGSFNTFWLKSLDTC